MSKHPFLAFDLETTGLSPRYDQVLQVGMVAYGGDGDPVESGFLVAHDRYEGDPYALQMNAAILRRLADGEGVDGMGAARAEVHAFVGEHCTRRPHPVGFNVGSFDVQFFAGDGLVIPWSHRAVELGTLWADPDGTPTTSTRVTDLYLHSAVTHDALQDARDAAALHARWVLWRSGGLTKAPAWSIDIWERYGPASRRDADGRLTGYPEGVGL